MLARRVFGIHVRPGHHAEVRLREGVAGLRDEPADRQGISAQHLEDDARVERRAGAPPPPTLLLVNAGHELQDPVDVAVHDVGDVADDVDLHAVGHAEAFGLVHAEPQEHALTQVVGARQGRQGHIALRETRRVLDGGRRRLQALEVDAVREDVADRRDVALDARLQHLDQLGVAAQVVDAGCQQVPHLADDLGHAQVELPRDESEELGDVGAVLITGTGCRRHAGCTSVVRLAEAGAMPRSARRAAFTPHSPWIPGPGGVAAEQR